MPLVSVYTSAEPPTEERSRALLSDLSKTTARILGKPEAYVMTCLMPRTRMTFGGSLDPACLVEIKSIGALDGDAPAELTKAVSALLHERLVVKTDRIYVVLADVPPHLWGFKGATFG
jgi:phenylpyruvate tautomerase PptA (4-oxalocrotonate tautomerase family)